MLANKIGPPSQLPSLYRLFVILRSLLACRVEKGEISGWFAFFG